MMKEHGLPPEQRLGHLPEGVGIPVGEAAPRVGLTDAMGDSVQLDSLWRDQPILVVFYRGGWCPYCNFQIRELTQAHERFAELGIVPVAISVDRVEEAARTLATYEIPFPVLADPELAAHQAFRVAHYADRAEVERLRGFGIDLEQASGQTHHVIAVPSLFLIDTSGIIRWSHADTDYTVRPSPEQILEALRGIDLDATLQPGASAPRR